MILRLSGDILNSYMKAPGSEKVLTTLGWEFGKGTWKNAVIAKPIWPKINGSSFISHLPKCMESLGYEWYEANPDLWLKPEIRSEDGVQNYSYLLCYVDCIHCIHHNVLEGPWHFRIQYLNYYFN